MSTSNAASASTSASPPEYTRKLDEPVSSFVDTLIKFGTDKVDAVLGRVTSDEPEPPAETGSKPPRVTSDESESKAKPPVERKAKKILEIYEGWELHELGLGRGVDGTDPRPWINKASFQVREARPSKGDDNTNLIGTNEGGMLRDYVEEVTSIRDQSAKLDVNVNVPNTPVVVSVGADLTRTWTNTQTAFGRRILSRTIAFQQRFDQSDEKLAEYVLECLGIEKEEKCLDTLKKDPTLFKQFLESYNITHYVNAITMGASMFIVEKESVYERTINPHAKLDIEPIASIDATATFKKKLKHDSKDIKCIGKLSGADMSTVEKEAVINIQLEPITNLFQDADLRGELEGVLKKYLQKQRKQTVGPYFISCNDSKIYLTVDPSNGHARVYGVDNQSSVPGHAQANDQPRPAKFYIILTDDGEHPHEFYIGWKANDKDGTMRYLHAHVSITGCNDGPLCLESKGKKEDSLFSINTQLTQPFFRLRDDANVNVNPKVWFKGQESFLIRCTGRSFRVDGFVAVQKEVQREAVPESEGGPQSHQYQYRTITKRNATGHDDENVHMAFRLHTVPDDDEEI